MMADQENNNEVKVQVGDLYLHAYPSEPEDYNDEYGQDGTSAGELQALDPRRHHIVVGVAFPIHLMKGCPRDKVRVFTWGGPEGDHLGGYSWSGDMNQFLREFVPVKG